MFTMLVSGAVKQEEPQRFNESGLFLIATGGTSFYVAVNSMPFGRPRLADIRDAVDFVVEDTYPARGRRGGTQNPWLRPPDRTGPS